MTEKWFFQNGSTISSSPSDTPMVGEESSYEEYIGELTMYEDSDEEHKPDGTEQANPETTKARIAEIKAKILNITAPNEGGLHEIGENIDALSKRLPPTHIKDTDAEMSKHKAQAWDAEEAGEIEYLKRKVAEEADAVAAAKLTELEIERNRRLIADIRKHHTGRGKLRPVTVSEYVNFPTETQVVGKGRFHQWGVDAYSTPEGVGTYSMAIVEMEDGTVRCVTPNLIKFED